MPEAGYERRPVSERYKSAVEKAASILLERGVFDEIEAYRLLVKMEKELGYPVTYDLVVDAINTAMAKRVSKQVEYLEVHAEA